MNFQEAISSIATALNPQQIILFGSRARGDFKPDSDYDLLVVVDDQPTSMLALASQALEVTRGRDFYMDVVVYPKSEFDWCVRERGDLPSYAMDDGKVLYARNDKALA